MPASISIITLGVTNMDRSIGFYEAIGFEREPFDSTDIAFFKAGGPQLALFPLAELAKDAGVDSKGGGFRGVTLARNVRTSREVDELISLAVASGWHPGQIAGTRFLGWLLGLLHGSRWPPVGGGLWIGRIFTGKAIDARVTLGNCWGHQMRYSLRPATNGDLEPMMAIGHEGIRPYVEAVRGWDEAEEERGFVAHFVPELISIIVVDGRDVGYIKLEDHGDHVYLDGIYVDEAHRSKGLGRDIIIDVISAARAERKRVRLRVLKPNPARRLYERLGFREIGEDRDHVQMEV